MSDSSDDRSDFELKEPQGEVLSDTPSLPGEVIAFQNAEAVMDQLGSDLVEHALTCVRLFGDFHIALSGGNTPMPFYRRLMYDPNFRNLPWRRTHLWMVDERRVPFDDDVSNFKHINEIIVEHADIPPEQVHPIHAVDDDAPQAYEKALRDVLGWREKGQDRLDFVLLGMGDNGHTASLFPETSVLHEHDHFVGICQGPTVTPPDRVTMTYPLLNASRFIAPLVLGSNKAEMINRVATGGDSYEQIPIKGIKPIGGVLRWYLDAAACGHDQD